MHHTSGVTQEDAVMDLVQLQPVQPAEGRPRPQSVSGQRLNQPASVRRGSEPERAERYSA